jgi:hypothetical protein
MDALRGIANEPDGAHAIVDAKVFDHILKSLEAKSPDVRQWACQIVARIAEHESITPAICAVLVAHFRYVEILFLMCKSDSESVMKALRMIGISEMRYLRLPKRLTARRPSSM